MAENKTMEVAVIGTGVIGVMSAWQLAARGHNVTVYDQIGRASCRERV